MSALWKVIRYSLFEKSKVSQRRTTNQPGFTLIELMVAISIVAILSTIGMVMYSSAQGTARDSKRKQTLTELATALETYKTANGVYPVVPTWSWYSSETGTQFPNNGGNWIPGLAPNYVKQLPKDPNGVASTVSNCGGYKREYLYLSNGQEYKLLSHCSMEIASGWSSSDAYYDPVRPSWAWQVCQGTAGCAW